MKRAFLLSAALVATAAPVQAQLFFFPDYAAPSAFGTPSTFIAATYGRGLNDASGKLDAYGAVVGRTGMGQRFTILGGAGLVDGPESELTFGGAIGADLLQPASTTQVSVQGGIGYFGVDVGGGETLTTLRFPIGVALKTMVEGPTANVMPFVMPKVNISRASLAGTSATETDFGASGGVSVTLPSGFGVHSAIDVLAAEETIWTIGVGAHYLLP